MRFSRQGYWRGLPFPSPGDLPDPGIEPGSPALQADSLPTELPGNSWSRTCWHKKKILSRISFFFPIQELQYASSQISKPSVYFYYQYYSKEKEDKAELFLSVQKVIKLYRYFLKSSVIVMLTDENVFMHHFSKKNYGIPQSPNSYPPDFSEHTWCHDHFHEASTVMTLTLQMRRLCTGTGRTPGQHGQWAAELRRGVQQAFWSGPSHSHHPQTAKAPGKERGK